MTTDKLAKHEQALLDEFEGSAKKILENNISIPPREILYHYTSFNNFAKRIIKNREFCYTDFRHLNDPMEVLLSTEVLLKIIKSRKVENEALQNVFWEPFCEIFPAILNQESFHKVRDNFEQIDNIESNIYTFSFSSKVDYLPMWRWYSDDGTGISIGLKPDYFDFSSDNIIDRATPRPAYTSVIYDEQRFTYIVNQVCDLAEQKIKKLIEFLNNETICNNYFDKIASGFARKLHTQLMSHLLPLMPAFKHHGYEAESEHRLYYLEVKTIYKPECDKLPCFFPFDEIPTKRRGTKRRKHKEGICLPYTEHEIPFVLSDKFSLNDIAEMWVGPCVDFDCARKQIIKLLTENGYDITKIDTPDGIKIIKSQAPYR